VQDISYTVPSNSEKGETVDLLRGVSGFIEPGKMTALVSQPATRLCRTPAASAAP
jgi:hypothetical protein